MSADDGLMEGGEASFKFERVGVAVEGVIESVRKMNVTDPGTRKPKYWDDGSPQVQFVFTLQTKLRESPQDDGRRRIFAKGNMLAAIKAAVKAAGHPAAASTVGGTLKVGYSGDEPAKTKGFSPKKLFRARYTPPPQGAQSDDWGDDPGTTPGMTAPTSGNAAPAGGGSDDDIPF